MGDILVLGVLAAALFGAVRSMLKSRAKGGCSGCSGCSESCCSCPHAPQK